MSPASIARRPSARGRLSDKTLDTTAAEALSEAARDFDEIAEDLESGAVEIRHPELMPQSDSEKKAAN
jgi:hypothetical protein